MHLQLYKKFLFKVVPFFPTSNAWWILVAPHLCLTLGFCNILKFSHCCDYVVASHGFMYVSLMTNDVEHMLSPDDLWPVPTSVFLSHKPSPPWSWQIFWPVGTLWGLQPLSDLYWAIQSRAWPWLWGWLRALTFPPSNKNLNLLPWVPQ